MSGENLFSNLSQTRMADQVKAYDKKNKVACYIYSAELSTYHFTLYSCWSVSSTHKCSLWGHVHLMVSAVGSVHTIYIYYIIITCYWVNYLPPWLPCVFCLSIPCLQANQVQSRGSLETTCGPQDGAKQESQKKADQMSAEIQANGNEAGFVALKN